MASQRLFLFGDQTIEKLSPIRKLMRVSKRSPLLRRFLREATDVVHVESSKLAPYERSKFFESDSLLTIAEENTKLAEADEVISTSLMCIARLGELIMIVENDPSVLESSGSKLHLLGLCTGLLPAAVAAMARDSGDIIKYGLEMIAVAFRLAHELTTRAKRIEKAPGCWAYTILGVNPTRMGEILDDFHTSENIPIHKHCYLAVVASTWTTLFGPPSTFALLWKHSSQLDEAPKLKLGSGAPVHSAHLPQLSMERILGQSALLDDPITSHAQIISTCTGLPYVANNLRELLRLMIDDIDQNLLDFTTTLKAVVSEFNASTDLDLIVVGPTTAASSIQSAFHGAGMKVNISQDAQPMPATFKSRGGSDLIAIVGMSGRFPGGDNVDEFWKILQDGQALHKKIPSSRFDLETFYDPNGKVKNSTSTPYGCFLDQPGLFDSRLFNVSPREAVQMDPLQRLLMLATYEAMEKAGYSESGGLSTNSKRIATYMGQTTDDWRAVTEARGIDIYYIPGVSRAFVPGKLNYHFKWEGASYNIDAACASSSTAVASACSALIARECDTAVAGGGSILAAPAVFAGCSRGGFLSSTGGCKTFSDDADGYCRGEGVGVVVLKRLEDAHADNDNILAVIRGSGRSYAADAVSITQPHPEAQSRLYRQVLEQACLDPNDISFVEMHGTGTQSGDTVEMQSITQTFANGRSHENPLIVGAVKANIGHGEAAAGITSLIKAVMMLQKSTIPPQPGMPFKLNHKFPPLDKMNVIIPAKNMPFAASKNSTKRRLLVNNFDASGGNTCLIVEDPPELTPKVDDQRNYHVIVLSARTVYSIGENKRRLLDYLNSHPEIKISDLAYTVTARRSHDVFRSSYCSKTISDLARLIARDLKETKEAEVKRPINPTSTVFAFTGQGALYPGMGSRLFSTCKRFRENILSYQKVCDAMGLPEVVPLISNNDADLASMSIVQTQLSLVYLELALADLWMSWGIRPTLLIGHSLGEYSALCVSGVLSISDTFHLVASRASLMDENCAQGSHTMLMVRASAKLVDDALSALGLPGLEVSCLNSPVATVVSGSAKDLESLEGHLQSQKLASTFLKVPYGFHSAQMDPILAEFETCAKGVTFAEPKIPLVSTLTRNVVNDAGTFSPRYLARQAREPVDFIGALEALKAEAHVDEQTLWFEIGPSPVCLGFIRSTLEVSSRKALPTIKTNEDSWKTISESLGHAYTSSMAVSWVEYHREYVGALRLLDLPTYAFDLKDHWCTYKEDNKQPQAVLETKPPRQMLSTCLQYVETETLEGGNISASFSTHTFEEKLFGVVQGHLIDGTPLCPASVFCDMAFGAAKYLYSKVRPNDRLPNMSLWGLEIKNPLVVSVKNPDQVVHITAHKTSGPDWAFNISFASTDGASSHEHGGCQIRFEKEQESRPNTSTLLHLVQKRSVALLSSAAAGRSHRLLKPVIYKLFANLVAYGERFQSIEELFVEGDYSDAVATVKLQSGTGLGDFTCSPYWVDSIVHLAGFMLNGDPMKPDDIAYISAGFGSFHLYEELSAENTYTTYACIQSSSKSSVTGDIYVFDGDKLIAQCTSLFFQKMPKKVLNAIFGKSVTDPKSGPSHSSHSSAANTKPHSRFVSPNTYDFEASAASTSSDKASNSDETSTGNITPSSQSSLESQDSAHDADRLLATVASETGFDVKDMEPSTLFSDMGVDSLMSISIISTAQRQMGMDLPASFFIDNPTVADVRQELGNTAPEKDVPAAKDASVQNHEGEEIAINDEVHPAGESLSLTQQDEEIAHTSNVSAPRSQELEQTKNMTIHSTGLKESKPTPNTTVYKKSASDWSSDVMLLQGRASSTLTPLFLIPGGAGSATAFIHVPPLPTGNRIYALQSPFLKAPAENTFSVEEIASIYLKAIRKSQPTGPYIIGGWSVGAVHAYEVTRQLLQQDEKILGLILMDMRVPSGPIPDVLKTCEELIDRTDMVTGISRPGQPQNPASKEMKEHLLGNVKTLMTYIPTPTDTARRPGHTHIIWAKQGLSESWEEDGTRADNQASPEDDSPQGNVMEDSATGVKAWFLAKRNTFGPNGWDKLVGDVECDVMDANHFSMMKPPHTKVLGQLLKKAMERISKS